MQRLAAPFHCRRAAGKRGCCCWQQPGWHRPAGGSSSNHSKLLLKPGAAGGRRHSSCCCWLSSRAYRLLSTSVAAPLPAGTAGSGEAGAAGRSAPPPGCRSSSWTAIRVSQAESSPSRCLPPMPACSHQGCGCAAAVSQYAAGSSQQPGRSRCWCSPATKSGAAGPALHGEEEEGGLDLGSTATEAGLKHHNGRQLASRTCLPRLLQQSPRQKGGNKITAAATVDQLVTPEGAAAGRHVHTRLPAWQHTK